MRLLEVLRSAAFRLALLVAAAFAVCILVLFGFFYWQTMMYVIHNIDDAIVEEAHLVASDPPTAGDRNVLEAIAGRLRDDPRRIKLGALFRPGGERIAGNVEELPGTLAPDGIAHSTSLVRIDAGGREPQTVRAVGIQKVAFMTESQK